MITVSMRSRPLGELNLAVKELWDAFSRLRHRAIWGVVRGAIASLEITFNRQSGTWHPHLHIVVDSEFIRWDYLLEVWREVTHGNGTALYIQKCKRGWERELIKYVTKVADLLKSGEALREFLKFAAGKRFIRTYGSLYNCAVDKEETHSAPVCKGCGTEMTVERVGCRIADVCGGKVVRGEKMLAYGELKCCNSS